MEKFIEKISLSSFALGAAALSTGVVLDLVCRYPDGVNEHICAINNEEVPNQNYVSLAELNVPGVTLSGTANVSYGLQGNSPINYGIYPA